MVSLHNPSQRFDFYTFTQNTKCILNTVGEKNKGWPSFGHLLEITKFLIVNNVFLFDAHLNTEVCVVGANVYKRFSKVCFEILKLLCSVVKRKENRETSQIILKLEIWPVTNTCLTP